MLKNIIKYDTQENANFIRSQKINVNLSLNIIISKPINSNLLLKLMSCVDLIRNSKLIVCNYHYN